MGCPVVTLPSGGLGSRWTASLYHLLGLAATAKDGDTAAPAATATAAATTAVNATPTGRPSGASTMSTAAAAAAAVRAPIAADEDEYVRLATALALDVDGYASALRRELATRVGPRLFARDDAVDAWVALLGS